MKKLREEILYHEEKIECPYCGSIETATVEHTEPFWSYVHECKKCKNIIQENEWQKI